MSEQEQERFTFPKTLRLLKKTEYDAVFANAVRVGDGHFLLLAQKNSLDRPRLGLAISKKQAKRAVERNRIKRVARESFRLRQQEMPAVDVVILARQGAVKASKTELFEALDNLWSKLHKKFYSARHER